MSNEKIYRIDSLKWWIFTDDKEKRFPIPLCPIHDLRLSPKPEKYYSRALGSYTSKSTETAKILECAEGPHEFTIPREYNHEKIYVINRIDSLIFKKMSILNLDEESIPVAKDEIKNDSPYWIRSKLTESKSGTRLIIWAGDRSKKNKAQLFIEPSIKRLSFDQNDDHPTEVFAKVEVTFADNNILTIEKK